MIKKILKYCKCKLKFLCCCKSECSTEPNEKINKD